MPSAERVVRRGTALLLLLGGCRTLPAQMAPATNTWESYRAQSRADRMLDTTLYLKELATTGQTAWIASKMVTDYRPPKDAGAAWYAGDTAARIVTTMLSFQTPSGGWSKHVDMQGPPRAVGQSFGSEGVAFNYIPTIDNGATISQLRFIGAVLRERPTPAAREAFERGVQYLLRAQLPSGGWPQIYPLQGGYHDATAYNDGAVVNVLRFLRDVSRGQYGWMQADVQRAAQAAFDRGIDGILADQVMLNGVRTVWGQQHDPLTRLPIKARSYELAGLTGMETSGILDLLMELDNPSPVVVQAVHAAADWLKAHPVRGIRFDAATSSFVHDAAAPISWARIYELPSLRPVVANRDGVPHYDPDELTDRRTGYAWYTTEPTSMLKRYEKWATRHPRVP